MKKKKTQSKKAAPSIEVSGYTDGRPRKKRLHLPQFSTSWYVYYYNSELNQKRISAKTDDQEKAEWYLEVFDPFNPLPPEYPDDMENARSLPSKSEDKDSRRTIREALDSIFDRLRSGEIEGKKVERYSVDTLTHMEQMATRYLSYCDDHKKFTYLDEYVDDRNDRAFVEHYNSFLTIVANQINPRTGRRMIQQARNYKRELGIIFSFLVRENVLPRNNFRHEQIRALNTSKQETATRKEKEKELTFTKEDFEQILHEIDERIVLHENRNDPWHMDRHYEDLRLMALLGFFAGLRRREIIYLNASDIVLDPDPEKCFVSVTAKPSEPWFPKTKESYRDVPLLNNKLISLLRNRLDQNRKRHPDLPHLFAFNNHRRYKPNYVSKSFREIVDAVFGRQDPRHLHTLRHSFCSYLVNVKHADIYDVKKWAGHEDIKTTLGYVEDDTFVNSHYLDFDEFEI